MEAHTENQVEGRSYLSKFQVDKFQYYFEKYFDSDGDGFITYEDFIPLQERILKFTKWQADNSYALLIEDLHREFYECLQEKTKSTKVSLNAWLDMWGQLTTGAMGMSHFPYWVQLLPKLMFSIIDTNKDGVIDMKELMNFYRNFVGIEEENVEAQTQAAYTAMTADDEYPLNTPLYEMIFANFLLGKNIHGPGKYIFGCFEGASKQEPFKVVFPEDEQDKISPTHQRKMNYTAMMIKPRNYVPAGLM